MAPPVAEPRRRKIVLDTAALIAGTESLFALGGLVDPDNDAPVAPPAPDDQVTFYTVPDVVQEVRDARARARLALLGGGVLVLRAPSAEALTAVTAFARATGDYSVLSLADLRVMALTWMLEVERDGGKSLKKEPHFVNPAQIRIGRTIPFAELDRREEEQRERERQELEQNDGWVTVSAKKRPEKKGKKGKAKKRSKAPKTAAELEEESVEASSGADARDPSVEANHVPGVHVESDIPIDPTSSASSVHSKPELADGSVPHIADSGIEDSDLKLRNLHISSGAGIADQGESSEEVGTHVSRALNEPTESRLPELAPGQGVVNDNDGEWINEENLEEVLARDANEEKMSEEDEERVGCVTTDFAMQNTLLQMGVKILTVDGRRTIRKMKHFALRCHACGVVTRELERKFCEKCGNAAMHRVAFRVSKNGVARAFINPKKQPLLRGTKYSIPMPRGGRHNRDLILREDQVDPVLQRRMQKQMEKKNVDVLDPTTFYNAGKKFNPHDRPMIVGYGSRNPNEAKASIRRKR